MRRGRIATGTYPSSRGPTRLSRTGTFASVVNVLVLLVLATSRTLFILLFDNVLPSLLIASVIRATTERIEEVEKGAAVSH
jgi:hypothetical protein